MNKPNKPREFWIHEKPYEASHDAEGPLNKHVALSWPWPKYEPQIHVIEHAAYTALEEKLEQVEAERDEYKMKFEFSQKFAKELDEAHEAENQTLREALNKLDAREYKREWESALERDRYKAEQIVNLESKLAVAINALKIYADAKNWRDTWKDAGKESNDFKYFYRLGHSVKDSELISKPYHYCMGKAARESLSKIEGETK